MPRLFINQEIQRNSTDYSSPIADTYANAILRTLASFKSSPSTSTPLLTSQRYLSPTLINGSSDNQLTSTDTSSLSSSSSSLSGNQYTLEAHLPLVTNENEQLREFQRLLSCLDQVYNNKKMSTKSLLSSSPHITDRYFFRSHSNENNNSKIRKNQFNRTPPSSSRKRYRFSSNNNDQYKNNVYKFSNHPNEQRSHSSDLDRYYFTPDNSYKNSKQTLPYGRSSSGLEQHSIKSIEGTPYLFSKTTESQRYPSTTLSMGNSEDTWISQRQQPHIIFDSVVDSSMRTSSISPERRQTTRMDTVTSTNGSLSKIKRSPATKLPNVRFEKSSSSRSYLSEARERLAGKKRGESPESFEKSVDRLVSSVNKKYRHQQSISPTSSLNYISQYYAKEDKPSMDYSLDSDDDHQHKRYYGLHTNRTHTKIMKNVNKSLIDRNYQRNKNRLKYLEENVRRYLRFAENQSLRREVNCDLLRCFSSAYLADIRREDIRRFHTRSHRRSYTYEDIQDIHMSSILDAYKMRTTIDQEKYHRLTMSIDGHLPSSTTAGQFSPLSLSAYSPTLNENMNTHSNGFDTDRRSYTSISQTSTNIRPGVDLFYEIMQESFRGVDASIAGHISKASQFTKQKSRHQPSTFSQTKKHTYTNNNNNDIDIKSNSSFWSDEEEDEQDHRQKTIPHQRKISRYLSTVNRSLLDRPSDLIADFYISKLNRNMQESVRHVEIIARDKARLRQYRNREFIDDRNSKLGRSLSAEHLYQVRKEHLRYKQPFTTPTSFTTEDVADIYKPFALENYKRKIAIELERRRRERQGHLDIGYSSMNTTNVGISRNPIKSSRSRITDTKKPNTKSCNNLLVVSPSHVVQRKEILMGRARRILTEDGSGDIIHHAGIISPPPVYAVAKKPSPKTKLTITANVNNQYEIPRMTTIAPPDFNYRSQTSIRQERDYSDGTLSTEKQTITSPPSIISPHRPLTKIYTQIPQVDTIRIGQADLIESEFDNSDLSMVHINPVLILNQRQLNELHTPSQIVQHFQIPPNNYEHARTSISPERPLLLASNFVNQLHNEQVTYYTEKKVQPEYSTLIIPIDEHIAKTQEVIPVFEFFPAIDPSMRPVNRANEISHYTEISFDIPQRREQPIIFDLPRTSELESAGKRYTEYLSEDDNYRLSTQQARVVQDDQTYLLTNTNVSIIYDLLGSNITNKEEPYQRLNVPLSLFEPNLHALLLEDLTTVVHKQHAIQVIDDNRYGKTCEKVEESTRIPIIVYDTEWNDEKVQLISNEFSPSIENAEHKYPETIEYEQIKINLPESILSREQINQELTEEFDIHDISENDNEQLSSLSDDSFLIRHQQQSNIHESPGLENPLHSTALLTLNYAHHNQIKPIYYIEQQEIISDNEDEYSLISSIHTDRIDRMYIDSNLIDPSNNSETSSIFDMEMFLNHFEESIDHEQHLPLINQISLSYASSVIERYYQQKNRALPIEWFKPTSLSHDEQLVEQWTVETDIDTIQQEGTLRRQNGETTTNSSSTDTDCIKEKYKVEELNNLTATDVQTNNHLTHMVSHCSPTSDYETDSLDKDNDTASTTTGGVIVSVTPVTNSLPSSSITNITLLSQSSPPLTSYTAPVVPIVYFLDALVVEQKEKNNLTKDFLLTIGFGQNEMDTKMNEITNTVSNVVQPIKPTWVNRSSDNLHILPTIIHHENQTFLPSTQQQINFATETQLEEDDTALLIHPHRLQYGYDLGENTQAPLSTFFEPAHLHLPIINEIYIYQMSFHNEFPLFYPPNSLPHILASITQENEILSPTEYQLNQTKILSHARIKHLPDNEEDIQIISHKLDQPTYIEHYHVQSLQPFSETSYVQINQPTIIMKHEIITDNNNVLSDMIIPTKYIQNETHNLNVFQQRQQSTDSSESEELPDQKYTKLTFTTPTPSMRVRPSASTHSGPIQEVLSMQKSVNVDMGTTGQRTQEATYQYFGETDNNNYYTTSTNHSSVERIPEATRAHVHPVPSVLPVEDTVLIPETIIEHISEDEKSTSSEEVVFEEWSEEFQCRRTDEYDGNTNKLLRTIIDETSDRIKGDVIKEEYKEKNVRIKGHKSYDIVKEVYRRVPANAIESTTHHYEEIPQPPPSTKLTTTSSTIDKIQPRNQDRHWSSEDTYTTEIVYDSKLARDIESSTQAERVDTKFDSSSFANYDRVRTGQYPSMPTTTQTIVSTVPSSSSSHYERVSTIVSPTVHYAEKRNQPLLEEAVVTEEYQVELEQYEPSKKREETSEEDGSDNYNTTGGSYRSYSTETDQQSSTRRDSDWRSKLRQIYAPPSDDDQFDQREKRTNGNFTAQRVSVIPSNIQQRELKSSSPSRHTVKEALVSISRDSSPEKQYHYSSLDNIEQKRKKLVFGDSDRSSETLKKVSSISPTDDDRQQALKRSSSSSSSIIDERRAKFEQQQHQNETTSHSLSIHKTDRPSFGRVGEIKNAFETTTTTNGSAKDETLKYRIPIATGSTEQRRRIFEEQEQTNKEWTPTTRRPINEYRSDEHRMSETHTTPQRVTDRISRFESAESKSTSRVQPTDRLGRTGFDSVRSALESSMIKTTPQSSLDITIRNKQIISSIDSDLSGPSHPIYQSTPKSTKQRYDEDAGHESEDELSDPIITTTKYEQNYDNRRRTSKTRLRDFSQSTSQPLDTTHNIQRTTSKFNETNMENILSHVSPSKGKGILIELSPRKSQSPTKSIHEPTKSALTSDSGIYEYSTGTSHHLPTSSSSWRNNASTSIIDDTTPITSSYYGRRQTSDTDQTITQNVDDSLSRSTYRYDTEILPNEPTNQQQRTVRRQITSSIPTDYENLTNYRSGVSSQGKIPITTQSRTTKPFVVDEIETIETETRVECQVNRTNESTTKTDQSTSPISSPKKIPTTTTTSRSPYSSMNELTSTKRVLLNDRPQYYESTRSIDEQPAKTLFKPIERHSSPPSRPNIRTFEADRRTMEVTSLSPQNQVVFGKNSPNEIIAVVRVPELTDRTGLRTSSSSTVRHGISEPELYERVKQRDDELSRLQYQRNYASSYRPPPLSQNYEQRQSRYRANPLETTNNYSSPITFPTRSASYHSALHDQDKQQHSYTPRSRLPYRPQTQHYTGSLGNLYGSNIDFEIEIEKRPPHYIEQPTVVSLDHGTRAIITTSKDGRVSVQNIAARPGNTVVINSDFHSSDRSLNRSSGYFSADEHRSLGVNTNYSSDELSSGANQNSYTTSSHTRHYNNNESPTSKLPSHYRPKQSYQKPNDNFNEVNEIVRQYYQPSTNPTGFNETINQIDALYNNLDIQTNNQPSSYDFSKSSSKKNRRKQLLQNPNEYSNRYTSTGFQHIPTEQPSTTNLDFQTNDNENRNWNSSSLNNLVMATPIRPSHSLSSTNMLTDYTTPGFGSTQNSIVQQNRLNGQSQVVQRNRTSVKQVKQKSAAKRRNGNIQGQYSDEEDDNDSPLSDNGNQSPSRSYNFTNRYQ